MINIIESEPFVRAFLALFFTAIALFYTLRIVIKKYTSPDLTEVVFPGRRLSTTWFAHSTFRLFRVLIWGVCVLRWQFPELDNYLGMVVSLNIASVHYMGAVLLLAGFGTALIGHYSLGAQWRSGIDPDGPVYLHTAGIYRRTRNPMFLGVKLAQIGFFLAMPSVFSAVCLIVGWLAVDAQLKIEEQHLAEKFAVDYNDYQQSVPRWLW